MENEAVMIGVIIFHIVFIARIETQQLPIIGEIPRHGKLVFVFWFGRSPVFSATTVRRVRLSCAQAGISRFNVDTSRLGPTNRFVG